MEAASLSAGEAEQWRKSAEMLRLISHPARLMILSLLCEGPRCVKDLNSLIPIVQPHLSQHIAALRRAQLVDFFSSGTLRCYYVVRPSLVRSLITLLQANHPVEKKDRTLVLRQSRRGNDHSFKRDGIRRKKQPFRGETKLEEFHVGKNMVFLWFGRSP